MFEVFSVNLQRPINADNVTDLSDTFKCPNCDCDAKYTLKAIDSTVRRKHFARKRLTHHCDNCPYNSENNRYIDNDALVKFDIKDIFEHNSPSSIAEGIMGSSANEDIEPSDTRQYIRTPKQLFNYCISNSIYTVYKDGCSVGDLFLDERNIYFNGNFQGKSGLYFVLGKTHKFIKETNSIEMYLKAKTPNNKNVFLNITIVLSEKHFSEIVSYILETFHTFAGHSIAILGEWECDKKYHIRCEATRGNTIYKFINEV